MKCILLLTAAFCFTGCNTVEGFGEDLQKGGKALQKAASKDDKKTESEQANNAE